MNGPLTTLPPDTGARRRAGLASQRISAVDLPIIPEIAALIRAHPGTISLGQGVVDFTAPVDLSQALAPLAHDPQLQKYQASAGLAELHDALRLRLQQRNGVAAGAFEVCGLLVTAGSNMGILQALLAVTEPGDEVILPRPYYFNHLMAVQALGCVPRFAATDRHYRIDPDAVEAACGPATRVVITVSPSNPSGAVSPRDSLLAVNRLCARRGLLHFSDEAYEDFVFGDTPHFSVASDRASWGHTLSFHSFSKGFGMAGWRVGSCLYPRELTESLLKIQDTNLICPPVASQLVALHALRQGTAWREPHLQRLAQVRSQVHERLHALDGLARFEPTEGAFYVLVDLPAVAEPLAFSRFLVERHRVATIPGFAFGIDPARTNTQRLSFGALDPASVHAGVDRFIEGCRAYYATSR